MATEIGIGVRVWIGWPYGYEEEAAPAIGQTGTIVDGPYEPGVYAAPAGADDFSIVRIGEVSWRVQTDSGMDVIAGQSILFPLDDGEPREEDNVCSQDRTQVA